MEKYKQLLDALFVAESDAPISNSSPEHAAVLLAAIFHYSHNKVKVFCGNLRKDVFGKKELISEIRCAAFRGVKIHFILEHPSETQEICELVKQFPNLIKMETLSENYHVSHFTVGDSKSFRFEECHDEAKALGCANRPDIASLLEQTFDMLATRCSA